MRKIFDEESKLEKMLRVEAALAKAQAALDIIPKADAAAIQSAANIKAVPLEKVRKMEAEVKHDIMALVKSLSLAAGQSGRFVHMGATSNDIIDTATALQLQEAVKIVRDGLVGLRDVFLRQAIRYKATIMLGRTHGQSATPITFGLKLAVYASEMNRHIERFDEAARRVCVGKMSGAVGTGAAFGPKALRIQELVMQELNLVPETASTQVVGRDRHAELVFALANIAASIEKFATEVRNLQRSEIREVAEPFDEAKQVGSSTMANKQNPITCENVCGLARIVRAFVVPALEDVPLWHERDLTNSSAERFIIPHALLLTDDILAKTAHVFAGLRVYPENMKANIEKTNGMVMSESVMIALTRKGMSRQEAHELLRKSAIAADAKKQHLRQGLEKSKAVSKYLTRKELEDALNPYKYTGAAKEIVEKIAAESRR